MHVKLFEVLIYIFSLFLTVSKNIFDTCEAINGIKSISAANFFNASQCLVRVPAATETVAPSGQNGSQ